MMRWSVSLVRMPWASIKSRWTHTHTHTQLRVTDWILCQVDCLTWAAVSCSLHRVQIYGYRSPIAANRRPVKHARYSNFVSAQIRELVCVFLCVLSSTYNMLLRLNECSSDSSWTIYTATMLLPVHFRSRFRIQPGYIVRPFFIPYTVCHFACRSAPLITEIICIVLILCISRAFWSNANCRSFV